jgi:hypothetical protein
VVEYVGLRKHDRKIDTLRNSGVRPPAASCGSDALLAALREPRRYPHPVGKIELIETRISWLLLTRERTFAVVIHTRHSVELLRASALALGARLGIGPSQPVTVRRAA